ncbi:MAG TPA: hypothetical protein VGJ60_10185 [Chloroflexota bacterium]
MKCALDRILGGMHIRHAATPHAPTAVRLAGWLRPFLGSLLISSALAAATTMALHSAAPPTESVVFTPEPARHWIDVWSVEPDGSRTLYQCFASANVVASDVVTISGPDLELNSFRQQVCADFRRPET